MCTRLLLATLCTIATMASGIDTIVFDSFTDGDVTNGVDALDVNWLKSDTAPNVLHTVVVDAALDPLAPNNVSDFLVNNPTVTEKDDYVYFRLPADVTLAEGESLQLWFKMRFTDTPRGDNSRTGFNLSYRVSGTSPWIAAGNREYFVRTSYGSAGTLGMINKSIDSQFINVGTSLATNLASVDLGTTNIGEVFFEVARTGASQMRIRYRFGDGPMQEAYDNADISTTFNQVHLRYRRRTLAPLESMRIDEVKVIKVYATTDTFSLAYAAGENGSLAGAAAQTVVYGDDGTAITAIPDTGYHFVDWSDAVTDNPRQDVSITADLAVTANFAINIYDLTYAAGPNGTVLGNLAQTVTHGANGTLITAVPDANCHFVAWSDGSLTAARQDTSVTADIAVTALFAVDEYTLRYTASPGGSIAGSSVQTVPHGSDGTLVQALPDFGHTFNAWSDGTLTAARQETSVTADVSVTAIFAANEYRVTFGTDGTTGALLSGATVQTVSHGSDCTPVTVTVPDGYSFVGWEGDYVGMDNPLTVTGVTGDLAITATFLQMTELTITVEPAGAGYGTTNPPEGGGPYSIGVGIPFAIAAFPNPGYAFVGWGSANATFGDASAMTTTVTVADAVGAIITANFAPARILTLAAEPGGTTVPAPGPLTVAHGTPVSIEAVADADQLFMGWESAGFVTLGDAALAETTATLTGDATVTATFAEAAQLAIVAAAGGATVPAAGAYTVPVGVAQDLAATPDEGYTFTGWLCDDPTAVAEPSAAATTVTLTGDATVTPVFAINLYTVVFRTDGTTGATVNAAAAVTFTVAHGDDCTPVTAVAPIGQEFTGWSGGAVGMDNPLTVTNVTSDLEIVANFGKWVAQGIVINLDANDVPDLVTPGLFFLAPKFYGVYTDRFKDPAGLKPKKASLKLLDKADKLVGTAVLRAEWTKKLRLYSVKDHKAALKAGTGTGEWLAVEGSQQDLELDLQVASKEIDDADPKNRFRSVYGASLAAPEAVSIAAGAVDAKGNATWLITGKWFGTKAPKAYREYTVDGKVAGTFVVKLQKLKTLKPTADNLDYQGYVDSKGKPSCMDTTTGDSALVVLVPAAPKTGVTGDIVIDNGVGLAVIAEPPPAPPPAPPTP